MGNIVSKFHKNRSRIEASGVRVTLLKGPTYYGIEAMWLAVSEFCAARACGAAYITLITRPTGRNPIAVFELRGLVSPSPQLVSDTCRSADRPTGPAASGNYFLLSTRTSIRTTRTL